MNTADQKISSERQGWHLHLMLTRHLMSALRINWWPHVRLQRLARLVNADRIEQML